MAKIGRNEPCPCGSGKKYKNCCLQQQEAAARALAAAAVRPTIDVEIAESLGLFESEEDELTSASNAAVDLVHQGKLDEAEQIARDLLERFPNVHDGWDRLGMVYEARGDNRQAADCYRKIIEFIRANPDDYEPGFEAIFHKLVNRLDPSAPS
jgi:tetratricopeptide (TPR) repeat protein